MCSNGQIWPFPDKLLAHNKQGGFELRGGALPLRLHHVTAVHNVGFGILLVGAHGTRIEASSASWTLPMTLDGKPARGDGLGVFRSQDVELLGSTFSYNHRAGASFWGCADGRETSFSMTGSELDKNAFALEFGALSACTAGISVTPSDAGDNVCDGGTCAAQLADGLAPSAPPPAP